MRLSFHQGGGGRELMLLPGLCLDWGGGGGQQHKRASKPMQKPWCVAMRLLQKTQAKDAKRFFLLLMCGHFVSISLLSSLCRLLHRGYCFLPRLAAALQVHTLGHFAWHMVFREVENILTGDAHLYEHRKLPCCSWSIEVNGKSLSCVPL